MPNEITGFTLDVKTNIKSGVPVPGNILLFRDNTFESYYKKVR